MNKDAKEALQVLVGLPLWSMGRAATLQWFAFGNERRLIPLKDGTSKIVSNYSLHVESAWRILQENHIAVASADLAYPAGEDPYADIENFNWDSAAANRLDDLVSRFMEEHRASPLIVEQVDVGLTGAFALKISTGIYLEVFPHSSVIDEYWRLFKPYSEDPHFVCTKEGMETY